GCQDRRTTHSSASLFEVHEVAIQPTLNGGNRRTIGVRRIRNNPGFGNRGEEERSSSKSDDAVHPNPLWNMWRRHIILKESALQHVFRLRQRLLQSRSLRLWSLPLRRTTSFQPVWRVHRALFARRSLNNYTLRG